MAHAHHDEAGHRHEHDHPHEHEHGHDHSHGHGHDHGVWGRIKHALIPHSHDHLDSVPTTEEATAVGIRAAWVSLAVMGATALAQLVIVWMSGSMALLADTIHNLGHLATTIPLIIAFHLGARRPTRRYTYGLARAEDLVGLFIGVIVAASAALIVWEAVRTLTQGRDMTNLGWVLAAALVGAAGNELVARYRIRAGQRIGSAALVMEGQHARTDALTSLAVVLGVVGAWLGLEWLDPVVGILIAVVILGVLARSTAVVVRRLMDGVEDGTVESIESTAAAQPGVRGVRAVRARWSGHVLLAEIDVAVDPDLPVSEARALADEVERSLRASVRHLDRAVVAVSPA